MYSMVLLMAMATAPEAPNCCGFFCGGYGYGYGCYGGCYGCWGGCYGCYGYGCYGYGGYAYGYGGPYYSGYTPWGPRYQASPFAYTNAYAGPAFIDPVYYPTVQPNPVPYPAAPATPAKSQTTDVKKTGTAHITVMAPVGARISIGGATATATENGRVFVSPQIPTGTTYYYKVDAEIVREGKTFAATGTVSVQAGGTAKITLNPNVAAPILASK